MDPNGAPLGRYMTIIDVRQFAHHRHHVTIHAEAETAAEAAVEAETLAEAETWAEAAA